MEIVHQDLTGYKYALDPNQPGLSAPFVFISILHCGYAKTITESYLRRMPAICDSPDVGFVAAKSALLRLHIGNRQYGSRWRSSVIPTARRAMWAGNHDNNQVGGLRKDSRSADRFVRSGNKRASSHVREPKQQSQRPLNARGCSNHQQRCGGPPVDANVSHIARLREDDCQDYERTSKNTCFQQLPQACSQTVTRATLRWRAS